MVTISTVAIVAAEAHVVIRRWWWSMPVLKFDQPQTNQVAEGWHLVVNNLMQPEEQRWPAVVLLLWLRPAMMTSSGAKSG